MITSDHWDSYAREVPKEKHLTDERNNLTLRTRIKRLARKTICFSRSIEVHEKVIGSFIENYIFYRLETLPNKVFHFLAMTFTHSYSIN